MRNDIVESKQLPRAISFADLDIVDPSERLFQGVALKNVDGVWSKSKVTIPNGTVMFLPVTFFAVQHIEVSGIIHEDNLIEKPGEPLPSDEDLKKWNAQIPEHLWQNDLNGGKRPPWHRAYGAYLIDPRSGALLTYLNDTNGAEFAIREAKGQIKRISASNRRHLCGVVELGMREVSKRYNKLGPSFDFVDWIEMIDVPPWLGPVAPPKLLIARRDEEDEEEEATTERRVKRVRLEKKRSERDDPDDPIEL